MEHERKPQPHEVQSHEVQSHEARPHEARLREALHEEAARHLPDREAMLVRIAAGRDRARTGRAGRPARRVVRLAGLGVVSALLLGASVAGTWAAVGRYVGPGSASRTQQPGGSTDIGSATSMPRPSASPAAPSQPGGGAGARRSAGPSSAASGSSATASTPATASTGAGVSPTGASPAGTRVQQGFLWSDGSVDPNSNTNWAQSDVTLKSAFSLSAFDVRLRVALTPGVNSTGTWSTVAAQSLAVTVTRQGGFLVYEWTLKPGVTLAPGTYTFAGQYDHAAGGRDAGQDDYRATATGHGSQVLVYGNFYPVTAK